MSVAYTALNQGQGEEKNRQPTDPHSTLSAPMAKVEVDGLDEPEEVHRVVTNNEAVPLTNNTPHIAVTEVPNDEKTNPVLSEDDVDGHVGNNLLDVNGLHYRPGTPRSLAGIGVGLNFDTELGSLAGDIPDINVYQHKKTLAQGMMDLALFSANANQLRYVLDSYQRHPYYWPSFIFIVLSLTLQVAIGIGLTWNALYNVKDEKEICIANKINNFTVIGIFLVVVVNVFISAFGVADPIPQVPAVVVAVSIGLIWNALYDIRNEKDLHLANKINNFTVIGIFLVVVINVFIPSFGVIAPLESFQQVPLTPAIPQTASVSSTTAVAVLPTQIVAGATPNPLAGS